MVRFDAYSATTTAGKWEDFLPILVAGVKDKQALSIKQGKGFHTFAERLSVREGEIEVGSVSYGGKVQGDRVMVEVKGEGTPEVVERLRSDFPHRCTRVDSCADFDAPGAFDSLLGACTEVKQKFRLKGERRGDWQDFPEDGRTLYLGATSSPVRARLYEKGRTREYLHLAKPDWARLEIQVRPAKEAKDGYSTLGPLDVWGASGWSRALAAEVLHAHVDPHPPGTVWRQPDLDRRLHWLCEQYGGTLIELLGELGTWECVGRTIEDQMKRNKARRPVQ